MRTLFSIAFGVCSFIPVMAQNIEGTWETEIFYNGAKYDYKLHLKKTIGDHYQGVSELRQKMQVVRNNYLSLNKALEKRQKYVQRVMGEFNAGVLTCVEYALIEPQAKEAYDPNRTSFQYIDNGNKPLLRQISTTTPGRNEYKKGGDEFPQDYLKYIVSAEPFSVETPMYQSQDRTNRVKFNEVGEFIVPLKNNLGFGDSVKVDFNLLCRETGSIIKPERIRSEYVSNDLRPVSMGKIATGFSLPADSLHFTLEGSVGGLVMFKKEFSLPTEPFFKTQTVSVSAASKARLNALSGYYGFHNTCYKEINTALEPIAKREDKLAQMWKAVFAYLGYGGYKANEREALAAATKLFSPVEDLARQGDAEALYLLFYACEMGAGGSTAARSSKVFLEKAADAGFLPAVYDLAISNYRERNFAGALTKLQTCYQNGLLKSAATIGHIYEKGYGVPKNLGKAIEWYNKGAAFNDPDAFFKIALLYSNAEEAEPDINKALDAATKAADRQSPAAMLFLGNVYLNGKQGIAQDIPKAIKWFKQAADFGDKNGMEALAFLYVSDDLKNVAKDEKSSYFWAKKAAEAGSANAMGLLARIYDEGRITDKNIIKSRFWYNQAVVNGLGRRSNNAGTGEDFLNFLKHADFSPQYYVYDYGYGDKRIVSTGPDIIGGLVTGFLGSYLESRMNRQEVINGLELIYEKDGKKVYGGTITSAFGTSLEMMKGDVISVRSYGTVKLGWMLSGGPNGVNGYQAYSYIRSIPHGAVMVGINNEWRYIGSGGKFIAPSDGKLAVAINDADYTNNQGYFDIVIEQTMPQL